MNETKNLLLKLFILLFCGVGWSSGAWAQSVLQEGKTYTIKATGFTNGSSALYLTTENSSLTFTTTTAGDKSCWIAERTGDNSYPWRFKNVANRSYYLHANAGVGVSNFLVDACSSAGIFHLKTNIGGSARWAGTWSQANGNVGFGNNGQNSCYTSDANGHYNDGNWTTDYEITERTLNMGNGISLSFVDPSNSTIDGASVSYINYASGGTTVTLTSANSPYNFGDVNFSMGLFSSAMSEYLLDDVIFDATGRTLKFVLIENPNILKLSDAPANGQWADNTTWFTWHNNRGAFGYLSTEDSGQYLDESSNLTIKNGANASGNRGGLWAFVTNGSGFNIYNNAYGPDFILGVTGSGGGARLKMYHKDNLPNGVSTLFVSGENSNRYGGVSHAYYFQIGTSGNNHLNEQSGYAGTWNDGRKNTDQGSAFTVAAIPNAVIEALPKYDVYTVRWKGATDGFDVNYTGSSAVFGKKGKADNGAYLILNKDSEVTKNMFASSDANYAINEVTVSTQAGHACKLLTIRIKDAKATEEYIVKINKPESHNDKTYKVLYDGDEYESGASIYCRPDALPKAIDFNITGADDYFVWGPVVGNHIVSFEVRDRVKTLQTGLYELQLKDQTVIDQINDYVKPKEGNINTRANQIYLAPTVFSVGNATMKFTGVPASTIGDETSVYVYVKPLENNKLAILSMEGYYARSVAFDASGDQTHTQVPIDYTIDGDGYLHVKGWGTALHPMEGLLQQGGQGDTDMKFAMYMPEQSQDIYDVYEVEFAGSFANTRTIRYKGDGVKAFGTASNGGFLVLAHGSHVPTKEHMSVLKGHGIITNVEVVGQSQDGQATKLRVTIAEEPEKWQFSIVGSNPNNEKIVYNGQEYESGTIVNLPKGTVINPKDIKTTSEGFVHGPFITTAVDQNDVNKVTFRMRSHVTEITPHKWYAIQLRNKEVTYYDGSTKTGMLVDVVNNLDSRYKGSYIYMGGNLSGNTTWAFELTGVTTEATEGLVYVDDVQVQPNGDLRVCFMLQNGKYVQSDGKMNNSKQYITIGRNAVTRSINDDTFIWKSKVMPWKNLDGMPVGVGYAGGNPREDDIEMYLTEGEVDAFKIIIKNASTNAELNGVTVSYNGNAHLYGRKRFTNGQFRFVEKGYHLELESAGHPDKSKFIARDGYVITDIVLSDGDSHDLTIYVQQPTYTNSIIHTVSSYYDDLDQETNLPGTGFIKRGEGLVNYIGKTGKLHTVQNTAVYEIPLYLKQGESFTGYEPQGTSDTGGNNARKYQRWYNYDLDGLEPDAATVKLPNIVTNLPTSNLSYKKANGYLTGTSYGGQFLSPTFKLPSGVDEYNVGLDVSFGELTVSGDNFKEPTLNMRVVYRIKNANVIADAIKAASEANKFYEVHNIMMPNIKKGMREDHTGADVLPLDMDLNNYWMWTSETEIGKVKESASGVHLVVEVPSETNTAGIINAMLIPGSASDNSGGISRASFNTGHFICFQYPGSGSLREVPANSKATINVYIQNGSDAAHRQKLAQFNLTFIPNSEPMIVPEAMASSRSDHEMASKYTLGAQMTFENVHVPASNSASQRYKYPLDFKNSSYGFRADPWAARSEYNITQFNGMSGPGNYQYTFYPIQAYQNNVANPTVSTRDVSDNDHFLYIDAADQAGEIFSIDLDAQLCVGSRLFCYGWVGSTVGNYSGQHPASVLINVIGYESNGTEHLISSFNPGMISTRGYDKDGIPVYSLIHGRYPAYERYNKDANTYYAVWQQVGFNFLIDKTVGAGIVRYAIQVINNSYNSDGGDIVLDNFKVYYSSSPASVDFTTPLCADETRHVRVHTDFDGLMSRVETNPGTVTELPVTYCFVDAERFDNYTGQMLKDKASQVLPGEDKYYRDLVDLSKPMIDYFDIDETTGTHKLKSAYASNESVKWLMEFAFGEAMVGAPEVNGAGSHKDHGLHSTSFKVNYEDNELYHYKYSVDDRVYREQTDDGTRMLIMKQPVVRHVDALVDEYKKNGWNIEDHERNDDGTIKNINPNYGKVKSSVNGIVHYYSPRMQAGKTYYIVFHQDVLTNDALNTTWVGKVATQFFNIEEPCTPLVKFKTPDAMHVITEVEKFYTEDPQANVCVDGKTLFNFDLHAAKEALKNDPETNKMNAHGTPGTSGYHVHTIDDGVLNYVYDWWVGNGAPYAAPNSIGSLKDYEAATSATFTYQYGAGENHVPGKVAGQPVNIKTAMEHFRFFYPNFNVHNPQSVAIRIPTTDEWNTVLPSVYNENTGYSLLQSEINALKEFVGEDKNGNGKLDAGEGLGLIVLYKQALNLPLDATKYTPDAQGNKFRYVTAHPIIPLQDYAIDETMLYCPEPRDIKLIIKEKAVEMYDGFAGMEYPDDMKNVPIRIGLSQVNGAKAKTLRVPVRGLKFAAGTQNTNFLRAQGITEAKPYGDAVFLKETTDTENTTLTVNTPIANLVGGVTTNDETADRYIELKFIDGVNLREGYTYTLTLPFEEDAAFVGSDCNCKNEMDITLKVVPEYQVWTGAAGNSDWTNDQNWARANRSELNAGNAATGDKIDSAATPLDDNTSYISNEANQTSKSFVPMYFTNVLFDKITDTTPAPELYKGDNWREAVRSTANPENNTFVVGLNESGTGATSTPLIKYDMEVGRPNADGNYECGLFGTYVANGITFKPGSQLINAQHLTYNKAWVEYELATDRWYTLASPLQNTFAGEWYSPTDGGKQVTPHFYDINYSTTLNDRFRPAYYQRSWDSNGNNPVYLKGGGTQEAYIMADWSYVYNDVKKEYSNGGFSVMADISHMDSGKKPADSKVLVRLPKADTGYTYYDINGSTGQKADDALAVTADRSKLFTDKLKTAAEFSQSISNETSGNNFFLVGNPFAANMDMDKFFDVNTQFERKYWIMTANGQEVSVKVDGSQWVGTSGDNQIVAPLQGFFVKRNDGVNSTVVYFTADMQATPSATATLKAKGATLARSAQPLTIKAQYGDITSTAVIAQRNGASKGFVATEDCETFIDSNIADLPTIYTVASGQAMTVNTVPAIDMIPLGILGEANQSVDVTFTGCDGTLSLYDRKDNSYTTLYEGMEVTMSARTTGRYFITSTSPTAIDGVSTDATDTTIRKGIYTLGGQYVGEDVKSLAPGLYIVNGVKMRVK